MNRKSDFELDPSRDHSGVYEVARRPADGRRPAPVDPLATRLASLLLYATASVIGVGLLAVGVYWRFGESWLGVALLAASPIAALVAALVGFPLLERRANAAFVSRAEELDAITSTLEHLLVSRDQKEAFHVIDLFLQSLFVGGLCRLYLVRQGRAELVASSAGVDLDEPAFDAEQCCAHRLGHPHHGHPGRKTVSCGHLSDHDPNGESLCVPMAAHGKVLGLLCWDAKALDEAVQERELRRVQLIAQPLSLALSLLSMREQLWQVRTRDPVTGLFDRRFFEKNLGREVRRSAEAGGDLALLVCTIDQFQEIKDARGHAAAESVLKIVAKCLRQRPRRGDTACRLGGEEFALLLPGVTVEDAREHANILRNIVAAYPIRHEGVDLGPVTVSFGVASLGLGFAESGLLFRATTEALYIAKRTGRNRVVVADRSWRTRLSKAKQPPPLPTATPKVQPPPLPPPNEERPVTLRSEERPATGTHRIERRAKPPKTPSRCA